jgi:hypothetical protein
MRNGYNVSLGTMAWARTVNTLTEKLEECRSVAKSQISAGRRHLSHYLINNHARTVCAIRQLKATRCVEVEANPF